MKKRIITCLLALVTVLVITSCGNKTATQEPKQNAGEPIANETIQETENTESTTNNETKDGFAKFEEELAEKAIAYEKINMAADMIGAVEGYAYKIGESKVELYRFDTESDAYKNAESSGKVVLEFFNTEIDILLNGEFGIINGTPETIEIFKNI